MESFLTTQEFDLEDYTCPSSQLKYKYLIVGTEGSTVETKFLVQDSFVDQTNLQRTNIAITLSNLGHRMILEELRWGDNMVLEGEYHCIPGYWEWTKDNSNIIQTFCEAWCAQTNTLLTSTGETSISLWDLHILGGLPISRVPYEECMFAAFHRLKEKNNGNMRVSFNEWIQFWCKKDLKYELAPLRKEKKSRRLSSTHNPTGEIPTEIITWSSTQEMTHYLLTSGPSLPRMVVSSGEGTAKPHPTYYIDDGKAPELELAYFMSLRFNYLPLRREGSFVIEPYSLHRFSHQFGFHQDIPGYLENDIRVEWLDEGLRYWRICISRATMSKATFPPAVTSAKKLYTTHYSSWWERFYGMVLEDNLDVMVRKAGSEFVTLLEDKSQDIEKTLSKVRTPLAPQHQSKKLNSSKVYKKEVVHTSTDKEKCPQFLFSSKRALQETNKTSKDRCWKRQRVEPSGDEVVDLRVVEVQSVHNPSRSMTIQSDKVNATGHPLGSPHEMPQVSNDSTSISGPKPKSISNTEQEQKTLSTSRGQTLKGLTPNSNELSRVLPKSNGAMSVFEGKGVVFNHKRKYILGLWEEICGKLSRTSLDNISSYKDDICEIFKMMSEMNLLDLSPLKSLVDSLFDHATSYDQEHSNFVDKAHEDKKMELISNAKDCLQLFKVEEGEKAKHVSSNKKSLKKVKQKLATLQGEKKVEEIQAKILATEDEIFSYENMILLMLEDSIRLEQKRECLEASCQDLTNYKLRLD
ncbi:hypothetical protein H5410_040159 [Solanum commersonii]|uniref:Aminotransferase-like plant mobile domain-containing protein n=1 Tax=Solanum commersonii TaxID=4109 RepID=A0A9J5XPA6_SOLCO|nr:hypothetical protein H5410_040159 [Solanum commersonii]